MTRINVVPVESLHRKHLVAEYKEITRPFGKVRKRIAKGQSPRNVKIPHEYTLGTGHETFFFDKLGYLAKRYQQLTQEILRRGYNANPVSITDLTNGIDNKWMNDYIPTSDAIQINTQRILERMPKED